MPLLCYWQYILCGSQWCFLEMLGVIGIRTAQWPTAFFCVCWRSKENLTLHTDVYPNLVSDIFWQTLLFHHFLFHIFPRQLGWDDRMSRNEPAVQNQSIWTLQCINTPCPVYPLLNRWCGTCHLERHIQQTFHQEYVYHWPGRGENCWKIDLNELFKRKKQLKWCEKTLIRKSPMSSSLRISWTIFRHSASGIMRSYCPAMSKSCKTHKCDRCNT